MKRNESLLEEAGGREAREARFLPSPIFLLLAKLNITSRVGAGK